MIRIYIEESKLPIGFSEDVIHILRWRESAPSPSNAHRSPSGFLLLRTLSEQINQHTHIHIFDWIQRFFPPSIFFLFWFNDFSTVPPPSVRFYRGEMSRMIKPSRPSQTSITLKLFSLSLSFFFLNMYTYSSISQFLGIEKALIYSCVYYSMCSSSSSIFLYMLARASVY